MNIEGIQWIFVQWLTEFPLAQWLIYNIRNSDLFSVEWLAMTDPGFTREI